MKIKTPKSKDPKFWRNQEKVRFPNLLGIKHTYPTFSLCRVKK